MMTVKEVSERTGVSIKTLHHYDRIGLLKPEAHTDSNYRLYDEASLERLQHILLYRELEIPLKDIKEILDAPAFDRKKALGDQIRLFELKIKHMERLIKLAKEMRNMKDTKNGVSGGIDFTAFNRDEIEAYEKEARERWGSTSAYKEYEKKAKGRSESETKEIAARFMAVFAGFGDLKDKFLPENKEVQEQVEKLRCFITDHYYTCSKEILGEISKGYKEGGEMNRNIDKAGGKGTGDFVYQAVQVYCGEKEEQ